MNDTCTHVHTFSTFSRVRIKRGLKNAPGHFLLCFYFLLFITARFRCLINNKEERIFHGLILWGIMNEQLFV